MLNLSWQQAMARPLELVGAFLGDVDESPPIGGWFAPQLGPADYMRFLEPPPCVGWFDFLNSALYQRMLNQAELYYYLPPYNDLEIAHRCVADFLFVFINR